MTISHVLLVKGGGEGIDEILSGLADVAREVGASQVHHGWNSAPAQFTGGFAHGLTTVVESTAILEAYLCHPKHEELVDRLTATGGTVSVADIDDSHARRTDWTEQ